MLSDPKEPQDAHTLPPSPEIKSKQVMGSHNLPTAPPPQALSSSPNATAMCHSAGHASQPPPCPRPTPQTALGGHLGVSQPPPRLSSIAAESQQCHTVWGGGARWHAMPFPRCHSNKGELKLPPPARNPAVMHSPHHPKGGVRQAAPSPNFGRAGGGGCGRAALPLGSAEDNGVRRRQSHTVPAQEALSPRVGGRCEVTAAPRCNESGRPQLPHCAAAPRVP